MRLLLAVLLLVSFSARAQYLGQLDNLPAATTPLAAGNITVVCQGGTTGVPGTCKNYQVPYSAVLPIATTSLLGGIVPDGTTISVNPSTGVASSIGGAASSVVLGTTTIGGGGTSGYFLSVGTGSGPPLAQVAPTGTGSVVLNTAPTISNPVLMGNTRIDGTGAWPGLSSDIAPFYQIDTFTGTTTSNTAAFGMYLYQTDESSNTGNGGVAYGFVEELNEASSNAVGARSAMYVTMTVSHATGNTNGQPYVGIQDACSLGATDPVGSPSVYSSCFGMNPVVKITSGVTGQQLIGIEVDNLVATTATLMDRIGIQVSSSLNSGYQGVPTRDDIAYVVGSPVVASSTYGFKTGLSFGAQGGNFGIRTTGTLIGGTGLAGAGFSVANGIDWHLGTFTGNAYNDGHFVLTGAGEMEFAKISDPNSAPGAALVKLTAEAGTTGGTCKIVARAGTSATPVTIIDNVGSGC
jgi:hypothetical protein